jgi:hypothetical protein
MSLMEVHAGVQGLPVFKEVLVVDLCTKDAILQCRQGEGMDRWSALFCTPGLWINL